MRHLKKLNFLAILGCGIAFGLSVGCSDDESSEQNTDPIVIDTTIDEKTGEVKYDTSERQIDTVMKITETGETTYVSDTVYVPKDTTLRWKGNSALRITEVMPINLDFYDEDGDDGSWIEIYNAGTESANLKGYSLIENLKSTRKWVFGDEIIKPNSFRVVFCDKKDLPEATAANDSTTEDEDGHKVTYHYRTHTNWKMEKDSSSIYLVDKYYSIRDSVRFKNVKSGMSWGIVDGGSWKVFAKPTPEAKNTESKAYNDVARRLNFDAIHSGFYDSAFPISLPDTREGESIRCTKNGSLPTSDSKEYSKQIQIDTTMVLRCAIFKDGALTNEYATKTFILGESAHMPVVAITVDSLFFREHYMHVSCSNPKDCPDGLFADAEFPIHVEYFEKGDQTKDGATWEIDAGISLMGNWSRVYDKKTVAINMRERYQDGWLHYPLFETRKGVNDKYKAFNLRNNGNRFVSDYIADAVGGAILEGSSVDYQRSRQVIVYYNGHYYGIHDMRERYNKNYVETNYGVDASTVTVIKHIGSEITASNGDVNEYKAMLSYVAKGDFSGENNEAYAYVKTILDVGSLADYVAAEIYIHNGDWPANNVRAWRSPDHPWKFMIYDLDHGFGWQWGANSGEFGDHTNMFKWLKNGGVSSSKCHDNPSESCFHTLYVKLIENPEFRRMFINRSAIMLQNYLNAKNVKTTVNNMVATMNSDDIQRDQDKFKQSELYYPGGFDVTGERITNWAEDRDLQVIDEYKSEFEKYDIDLGNMIEVTIKAEGKGQVYVEDLALPKASYTGKFFSGIGILLEAKPSGGAIFDGWSDGSKENPRIVEPEGGATYTATFK